jgi:hypothetical protein
MYTFIYLQLTSLFITFSYNEVSLFSLHARFTAVLTGVVCVHPYCLSQLPGCDS